jgi:hypothetical protein
MPIDMVAEVPLAGLSFCPTPPAWPPTCSRSWGGPACSST